MEEKRGKGCAGPSRVDVGEKKTMTRSGWAARVPWSAIASVGPAESPVASGLDAPRHVAVYSWAPWRRLGLFFSFQIEKIQFTPSSIAKFKLNFKLVQFTP